MNEKEVFVYLELEGRLHHVGKLWGRSIRDKESASFQYDKNWLANPESFALEPALSLVQGTFHTGNDRIMFGAIGDSAPDRWGRILMRRAAFRSARKANKQVQTLTEMDYLLGVYDEARQGALRFSQHIEGPFLEASEKPPIPPLIELPRLLSAAEKFLENNESEEDLRLLLAPGSSLGGARPKASVRDKDGQLAIAKFSRKDDDFSSVLWEAIALSLASKAHLKVPEWRIHTIKQKPVLILRRFDRKMAMRIPFLSALSMLGGRDNSQHSYLELVDALRQYGAHPHKDTHDLWRRVVFNILISNTDDHMRNHAFLYERYRGWTLSPVYDVNPCPVEIKPRILTTNISFDDGTASLELAFDVIKDFGLHIDEAKKIAKEVGVAVSSWKEEAKKLKIPNNEIDRMSSAFDHKDLVQALKLDSSTPKKRAYY